MISSEVLSIFDPVVYLILGPVLGAWSFAEHLS